MGGDYSTSHLLLRLTFIQCLHYSLGFLLQIWKGRNMDQAWTLHHLHRIPLPELGHTAPPNGRGLDSVVKLCDKEEDNSVVSPYPASISPLQWGVAVSVRTVTKTEPQWLDHIRAFYRTRTLGIGKSELLQEAGFSLVCKTALGILSKDQEEGERPSAKDKRKMSDKFGAFFKKFSGGPFQQTVSFMATLLLREPGAGLPDKIQHVRLNMNFR